MDRGRAAAALLALAACIVCANAAPTASDQTALEVPEGPSSGCFYNFQHYGEGDRIMTNEPCLNCTCHNRMLMCYLRVCPFTKPIGQDCTIEKRADQCCPIVTCPDVPVDLLTSTSTSSPAEYGATGLGKLDKYGCSMNGKYFPEGSKVPPSPNKPCEHCYCIRNMTTCVMQECTLHVDGCTPIYHKDVCCPVRYSCDHPEDEIPLLDDMTTTVRPTPGFLLTTTTMLPVTQPSQNCVHDEQIVPDGALIKTEKACEHCYCMKGDIVCVVQECGTPMENEGKNCTSLPPRQGQCCPDTYICEGDELSTEVSTETQDLITVPPRRTGVEGSGYRNEPDEPYSEIPPFEIDAEGSGEEHLTTLHIDEHTFEKVTPQITETSTILDISLESSTELDKKQNTALDISDLEDSEKFNDKITTESSASIDMIDEVTSQLSSVTNIKEEHKLTTNVFVSSPEDMFTTETPLIHEEDVTTKVEKTTRADDILDEATLKEDNLVPDKEHQTPLENVFQITTQATEDIKTILPIKEESTTASSLDKSQSEDTITHEVETITSTSYDLNYDAYTTTPKERIDVIDTTSINPIENEIHESVSPIYSPGRIPGEGDCLLNSITYENNSVVPSTNNCHTSCRCISSIIKCDPIICSAPPEYMNDCQPIYDSPESCCPTYVCSTKETIPPESHNQMSGIDSTKPVLASECSSPDCVSLENNAQPITPDCLNNECSNRDKDASQETQEVSCKGNECKEKHPDLHHETPTNCLEENGCTKPVEVHTQEDCTDSDCKMEPVVECSGSDCVQESITVTESELSGSRIHEKPVIELTTVSDVTNKIETPHDTLNPESPDREPVVNTDTSEEYITVPIKTSTDISEMVTSHTEAPELHTIATNNEITELPDQHITPTNTVHTETDINITDFPIIEKEQSTLTPTSPADIIEHKVTEADYSNEIKHETLSENKYETISDDEIRKTTIPFEQATAKVNEQPVTDNNQLVTTELYEIKSDEPITPMQEEVRPTYSPDIHEHDHKEPTTGVIDHSPELSVTTLKDKIDTEQGTTESVIKESVTNQEDIVAEGIEDATTKPALDSVTVVENKVTEKSESETVSYPVDAISTKEYENTSEYSAVREHQLSTKLDEHYTESPSTSEIEMKDKVTDSITTVVTESDIKVTETIHTSSESDDYKPISESTYDLSTDKIEQIDTGSDKESTELPEIYTELSATDQAKLDEQKTDVTEKLSVTEKIEHPVTEGIKESIEVSLGDHEETLQTTESTITDGKPIEELKPTETQYTSVTPAVLLDEVNENTIPEIISTEKIIETDEHPVTESLESEQKLHTNPPATILTTTKDLDQNAQDLYETDKKTTEPKITTVSEEYSSTASYSIPDNKIDTSISSLEVTTSVSTEKELHISTEIVPTKIPENIAQDSMELNTEKPQEELPHTQATDSFDQHDSYTTEEGYPKTTSQANEKDLFEIPNVTTILPLYTEEIKTPLPEDELLYTHEDNLSSHKQDSQSDLITTQENQQSVSLEIATSSGVTMISNVETTTNIPSQNQQHESESLFTTVKDVLPNEPEIDTKKPSLELSTTLKYEEHDDTTDSIINVHVGDDERPNIDTKPPSIDMEPITEKTESSTKSEGTSIQEISTVNENLVGVNVPGEIFTENPVPTSVQGITDNKINDNTESYTIIPEKTDVTTALDIEIDMGTKKPEIYSTSIQDSIPAVSTGEPDVTNFTKVSVSEMDEKKTEEEHALSTTAKPSDLNTEITTAMESITLADVEQHTVTTADNENRVTSSPIDVNSPNILDHKLDTTTVPEIAVTEIQNSTPLEEMPTNKYDKETMPAFDSTTQRDIPKVTSIVSEVESSTIIKDDSTVHEENKLDSSNVNEDSLQTKRPEQQKPEVNTEKDIEQSGEPVTDHDNQQNVIPLEVSTLTPIQQESGEPVIDHDNQQNVIPLEVFTQTPIQQETTFTPITSENLSSPDSAMSLVTDKVETVHVYPIPESTPSILTSVQDVPIVTTETLPVIDQGLINTEKSVINEPEVYPAILNDPIESDIKTTSLGENIYSTELNKRPDYITELPEETTTRKILNEILGNENNEILLPSVTEEQPQLNTELPDSTIESQSVTKESMPSNDLYESTTNVLLEKEMEVEPATKESTPGVGVTDQYETTKASLLEKEAESQPSTKEPLPSINQYEPTISVLIDKDSEKDQIVTNEPMYPTTQSSQELYETTITLLREKDTENESEKVTQQPISSNTLYEATTIISDVVTDKENEIPVTEQSGPTKDLYEITTTISLEKATEKEIENQPVTIEPIHSSDVSETTDSVVIDKQTEKDVLMEPLPNKDVYEITTTVITEKPKETEIQSVTKESPSNDLYDTTTSRLLEKQTIKETEYQTITEESISTNNLYEPTTSHLLEKETEKEIDSVTQGIGSSSASSLTTVGLGVETTTAKIPESANDVEKSTESVIQYSETTPYHIELQEHTHQSIDETSSKMPIDEDSTTEQYVPEQPDRGDVPNKEDNVNILPTIHDEGEDLISLKEEKSTTPKYITPDRESTVHSEVTTENDQTISQSSSEAPKEEEKYSVIPIETETHLSPIPEIEAHTEKHIPDELEPHQTEVPADGIAHTEEVTKATTHPISTKPSEESTIHSEDFDKPEEKPVETGTSTEVPKPELNEPPSDDLPAPDFPTSGAGGYGQEPDYGDSEDQAFGPGTCRYGGKVYVSAQQIPRDDPCDFCFCFRSDIICLQQSCPPPIHGCHEEPIQGFCCPRYECPVSMATTLNVTTTTTTTTTTLPPHFLPHAYKGAAQKKGCQIKGHTYKVGEVVRASSGPCLHCTCGGDGQMKCDPKACTPEPMLRQMIAAAVSAKRRR